MYSVRLILSCRSYKCRLNDPNSHSSLQNLQIVVLHSYQGTFPDFANSACVIYAIIKNKKFIVHTEFLKKKRVNIVVIGLGNFGMSLAIHLSNTGNEVIVADHDLDKIEQIKM